jgi:hypothetical protein
VELGWWHRFCHAGVDVDDEGWNLSLAFPPFFFHLSLEGFPLWKPTVKHIATWDRENPTREAWLTDRRECRIAIHGWAIWINPWSKTMEWDTADPWWVRGLTIHVDDLVLGKTRYQREALGEPIHAMVPMPEGNYPAVFQRQRQTWKRPRWFAHSRESFDITIPKGIPFAGKGENSWDCDDDGLFGMSAEGTLNQAIVRVQQAVNERRKRYGHASPKTIAEALS